MGPFKIASLRIAALAALPLFAAAGGIARATPLYGGWTAHGLNLCWADNTQGAPSMLSDGAGGFFVAWEDSRATADSTDLYVEHVLGDGTLAPGWPLAGAALCTAPGNQNNPQLASDGAGGFFAVWEDSRGVTSPRLFAQHMSAAGTPAPGWAVNGIRVCGANAAQRGPAPVADDSGGVIVAWEDYRAAEPRVFVQHLRLDGTLATGWTAAGIAAAPIPGGQVAPVIATDGAGGAIMAWTDGRASASNSSDIYAQRLNGDGTVPPGWSAVGAPVCAATGAQERPRIVDDGSGGAFVVWMDPRSSLHNIYAQHLTSFAFPAAGWANDGNLICGAFPAQYNPAITTDGLGAALIAWTDTRSIDGSGDIYAQRVEGDGTADWTGDGVALCTAPQDQLFPSIVHDGTGGAIVAWQDGRFGTQTRPFLQRVTVGGTIADGWPADGRAAADTNVVYGTPVIVPNGGGGVFVTWSGHDLSTAPAAPDIYAARVEGNALVPALASLILAEAGPHAVRLRWSVARAGQTAVLERTADGVGWAALATLIADGSGQMSYEDRDVTAGERLGYRLRLPEGVAGEAWVTVPRAALAIRAIAPRPASDRAQVSLALADSRPARLELFDLAGRRRWRSDLDGASPEVSLALDLSSFEPGLYVMRLVQADRSATARLLVAR